MYGYLRPRARTLTRDDHGAHAPRRRQAALRGDSGGKLPPPPLVTWAGPGPAGRSADLKNECARPAKTPPPQKGGRGHRRHRLEARRWGRRFALAPGPAPHWWAGLRMPRPAPDTLAHLLSSGGDPAYLRDTVYWHRPQRRRTASGLASKERRQ